MKKIILICCLFLTVSTIQSQEIKKNKNAKTSLKVDGICGMCKTRIETAALKTKGVKFALWSIKTHELKLIIDERKTNEEAITKNILAVGHDVAMQKATTEAYNSVHPCCKYRDEEIIQDHTGKLKKQQKQG